MNNSREGKSVGPGSSVASQAPHALVARQRFWSKARVSKDSE